MATYLSPGVYVQEVASGSAPIAGVGTSTAGFIGIFENISTESIAGTTSQDIPQGSEQNPSRIGTGDAIKTQFERPLPANIEDSETPVVVPDSFKFFVPGSTEPIVGAVAKVEGQQVIITFPTAPEQGASITGFYTLRVTREASANETSDVPTANTGEVKLCTNFSEFKKAFGDFSEDESRSNLAHAVFGFFRNGGTRCFVTRVADSSGVDGALEDFAAIDEIAIVAVPGSTDKNVMASLTAHCESLGDRVAIFDSPAEVIALSSLKPGSPMPGASNYAAYYYPWIEVFDPATKASKYVPPSGHMAGIYARVDNQRGVHKAPANEVVLGATGLQTALTRAKQDDLNPQGVNCIRNLNGNITVWGARTWGGDDNGEFKYINIRRLFNFVKESIDEGTQWVVFEPNSPELWAKIRRNISAFLTMVWRSGALFGATPEEAFFVQCDAETNPPEVRDAGRVVTKIGIAVVKPAEFVIFEIGQWAGPGGS